MPFTLKKIYRSYIMSVKWEFSVKKIFFSVLKSKYVQQTLFDQSDLGHKIVRKRQMAV